MNSNICHLPPNSFVIDKCEDKSCFWITKWSSGVGGQESSSCLGYIGQVIIFLMHTFNICLNLWGCLLQLTYNFFVMEVELNCQFVVRHILCFVVVGVTEEHFKNAF